MLFALRVVKRLSSLLIILMAIALVVTSSALAIGPHLQSAGSSVSSSAAELELSDLNERSSVYAADGTFMTSLASEENRKPVELDEVPQQIIDAILAVEDADFYRHNGVNFRGTLRALVENVNAGGITGGGSTITQQLVKLSLLNSEQNLERKSLEAFYAMRLEEQMSKDEILERYLNTVYFGSSAYGVKAAAETYWGYEDLDQVGWAEAALLAGIVKSPNSYNPTNFPAAAQQRRAVVLNRLVATGHITEEEAEKYKLAPLPAERQETVSTAPRDYFTEEVLQTLLTKDPTILGGEATDRYDLIFRGGLKIYTSYRPDIQAKAELARDTLVPETERGYTVAVATVESKTGAIVALVGGPGFETNQFNLATQALNQPGSAMKTFVLAALFEDGYSPRDRVRSDGPCLFPQTGKSPYRVGGGFRANPWSTLTSATWASNNCAFVRLGLVAGADRVTEVAERLGIELSDEAPFLLSLPLGVEDVRVLDMAAAYSAFANEGVYNEPWLISRVEDRDGNVIYEHTFAGTQALQPNTARLVADVLEGNVQSGTGKRARLTESGHPAAGKTGTTQDFKDAWFVGFTEYYSTAVWLGDPSPEPEPIRLPGWNAYGGSLPAAVWGAYMDAVHFGLPAVPFPEPDSVRGGTKLKVLGEMPYCPEADFSGAAFETTLLDLDSDGREDCIWPVTESTTTTTIDPNIPTDPNWPNWSQEEIDRWWSTATTAPPAPANRRSPVTTVPATPSPSASTTTRLGGG